VSFLQREKPGFTPVQNYKQNYFAYINVRLKEGSKEKIRRSVEKLNKKEYQEKETMKVQEE
jgi:hypothetical protein